MRERGSWIAWSGSVHFHNFFFRKECHFHDFHFNKYHSNHFISMREGSWWKEAWVVEGVLCRLKHSASSECINPVVGPVCMIPLFVRQQPVWYLPAGGKYSYLSLRVTSCGGWCLHFVREQSHSIASSSAASSEWLYSYSLTIDRFVLLPLLPFPPFLLPFLFLLLPLLFNC